ncbi:DUF2156 domain-containing protein [Thermoplasmatota archaeon]
MIKMLSITDFKLVELQDRDIFNTYYAKYPQVHSDYLFTTIISWMDYAKYHFTTYKNNLIIFTKIDNKIRLRPPIGDRNKNIFDEVINLVKTNDTSYPISAIDSETKNWFEKNYPNFVCIPHRDYFDYVYLSSDIAELEGSKYSKIRNRLNKFKRKYEYETEIISNENMASVKEFLNRWCLWKDCESDPLLKYEKKAIIFSMDNFFELNLEGIVIKINDKIEAISVYEKMNNDTAVIHYEKASPYYDEIYKAINNETAKKLRKKYRFINRESDMGVKGLKKAKMSYKPDHMVELYHLEKESLH